MLQHTLTDAFRSYSSLPGGMGQPHPHMGNSSSVHPLVSSYQFSGQRASAVGGPWASSAAPEEPAGDVPTQQQQPPRESQAPTPSHRSTTRAAASRSRQVEIDGLQAQVAELWKLLREFTHTAGRPREQLPHGRRKHQDHADEDAHDGDGSDSHRHHHSRDGDAPRGSCARCKTHTETPHQTLFIHALLVSLLVVTIGVFVCCCILLSWGRGRGGRTPTSPARFGGGRFRRRR